MIQNRNVSVCHEEIIEQKQRQNKSETNVPLSLQKHREKQSK